MPRCLLSECTGYRTTTDSHIRNTSQTWRTSSWTTGTNRTERKAKTLPKIKSNLDAIPIKLADRIANVRNAIKHNHSMIDAYVREHAEFKKQLYFKDGSEEKLHPDE